MKFPRLSSTMCPRAFRGAGSMLLHKIFKIRINLAENEFQTTKFPDFLGKFNVNRFCNKLLEVSFKFPDFYRLSRSLTTLWNLIAFELP